MTNGRRTSVQIFDPSRGFRQGLRTVTFEDGRTTIRPTAEVSREELRRAVSRRGRSGPSTINNSNQLKEEQRLRAEEQKRLASERQASQREAARRSRGASDSLISDVNKQFLRQTESQERLFRTRETVRGLLETPLGTRKTSTGRKVQRTATGFIADIAISPFAVGEGVAQGIDKLRLADKARGDQGLFGGASLITPRSSSPVSEESARALRETGKLFDVTTPTGRETVAFAGAAALIGSGARPVRRVTDVKITVPEAPLITGRVVGGKPAPKSRPRVQTEFDVPTLEVFDPSKKFIFRAEQRGGKDLFFGKRGQASLDQVLQPPRLSRTPDTRVRRTTGKVTEPVVELSVGLEAGRLFPVSILTTGVSRGAGLVSRQNVGSGTIPRSEVFEVPDTITTPGTGSRQTPISFTGLGSSTAQSIESFNFQETTQKSSVRSRSKSRKRRGLDFDFDFLGGSSRSSRSGVGTGVLGFSPSLTASVFKIKGLRSPKLEVTGLDIRPLPL